MNLIRRHFLSFLGTSIGVLGAATFVQAQTYPARPIRVVVPFAPGGATDIIARPILQELSKRLGQQFYVDNLPGASGNIGTAQAAKAMPDGYTLLFAFSSHVTNPSMFNKLPYDPLDSRLSRWLPLPLLCSRSIRRSQQRRWMISWR